MVYFTVFPPSFLFFRSFRITRCDPFARQQQRKKARGDSGQGGVRFTNIFPPKPDPQWYWLVTFFSILVFLNFFESRPVRPSESGHFIGIVEGKRRRRRRRSVGRRRGATPRQVRQKKRRGGKSTKTLFFSLSLSLSLSILFPSVVAGSLPEKENNFLFYLFLIWPNFRQFRDFKKRIVVVYFVSHFVCTCRKKVGFRDNNKYKMTSQVKAEAAIEAGAAFETLQQSYRREIRKITNCE